MTDDQRLDEILAEIRRLHRRLDVVDRRTEATHMLVKRIAEAVDEMARLENRQAMRDLANELFTEEVDMPDDIRMLLDPPKDR